MASSNCPGCGGAVSSYICEYCGIASEISIDSKEELKVLQDYHMLIAKSKRKKQEKLLKHGYIPNDKTALIEAGVKCISLTDEDDDTFTEYVMQRLHAIAIKLKINGNDSIASKSADQFEKEVGEFYRKSNRFSIKFLVAGFIITHLIIYYFKG